MREYGLFLLSIRGKNVIFYFIGNEYSYLFWVGPTKSAECSTWYFEMPCSRSEGCQGKPFPVDTFFEEFK